MQPSASGAEVLAVFRLIVEERTGINYGESQSALFFDKLTNHATESGFSSLMDFYYWLRYDDADGKGFAALVEALVVGETYFFREFEQLKVIVDHVVVPAVRTGLRPRIWSAACATGEEPLTVAMMLADRGVGEACDLIASDISHKALQRAQSGRFTLRALRAIPDPNLCARWLTPTPQGPKVHAAVSQSVDWRQVNLVNAEAIAALGKFDVILCRNVLIYFSDKTICSVVDSLRRALRPQGYLAVGASESLLRLGLGLHCEEKHGAFFYRPAVAA